MSLRASIEDIFQGRAFARPLFNSYPGGLRFELSEGGSNVTIFLGAMRKVRQICEPGPGCSVYLADIKERLLVLQYDYRGMDVVGPAHDRLVMLYRQFHAYLLEYDLDMMRATFEPG